MYFDELKLLELWWDQYFFISTEEKSRLGSGTKKERVGSTDVSCLNIFNDYYCIVTVFTAQ